MVAAGSAAAADAPNELGRPFVRDFPPGRSNLNHLSPAVVQDTAGYIYIANSTIVRYYDGTAWTRISLPSESAGVRQFARTADGTIYLAGAGVIGYLQGAGDAARFVSLAGRLPPTATGYDELYDALAVGETVYFADEEKLLIWREGRFTVIACRAPAHSHGARLHRVGDSVYATRLDGPLDRLTGDRLETVADDPFFRRNQIALVEAGPEGSLSLLTEREGFFQWKGGRVTRRTLDANRWLAGRTILRALRLRDGSLAVAFTSVSGEGGMRFDAEGRYVGPIDNSTGLYVKTLRGFFQDREGGLWIGSETGVFRLEWPSPMTLFDGVTGLGQGAVADVARHEGRLYAATGEGVYRLIPLDEATGGAARFERIANYPAYSLLSHPAGLLVLGYADLWVQTAAGFRVVAKTPAGGGRLLHSAHDPDRIWVRGAGALRSLRYVAGGWREDATAEAAPVERADDDGRAIPTPALVRQAVGAVSQVREEKRDGGDVLWICGANGLVRVDRTREFSDPGPFATFLTAASVPEGARVPRDRSGLRFGYVALRHQIADGVTYQTRLDGYDREWSPWSTARERVFTDLPPGRYRFETRARDADGRLATAAASGFAVLLPWWLTLWAELAYAVIAAGLIVGVVQIRTRALRRRAARLERVVEERTAELATKNTELARLHQLELDEKIAARLAEQKARIEVLRYQLNPHFLFNTLAAISAELPASGSAAQAMVERLAEFCRLTLHRSDDGEHTTVGEEIRLLRTYLEIEQSRWGDLLEVEIACDPELDPERLPHFLLLPLVENGLKFGHATSPDRVGLRLAARREPGGGMVFEVANTGEWIEPAEKKNVASLGIGLDNLRERLARHFPRSHELTVSCANGWVTFILRIFTQRPR